MIKKQQKEFIKSWGFCEKEWHLKCKQDTTWKFVFLKYKMHLFLCLILFLRLY